MDYRNKQMNFRVTEAEHNVIRERMALAGITHPSAYLRKMAMNGYIINLDLSDVKELVRLSRINANNLNQYAKKANESGSIYETDVKDLQSGQAEIIMLLRELLGKLSDLK